MEIVFDEKYLYLGYGSRYVDEMSVYELTKHPTNVSALT
jgi:hypothetical protein